MSIVTIILYIFFALLQSSIGFSCLELSFPFLFMQFLASSPVKSYRNYIFCSDTGKSTFSGGSKLGDDVWKSRMQWESLNKK